MSASSPYFSFLTTDTNMQKFGVALALGGGLVLLGKALSARLKSAEGVEQATIPAEKISLFGFMDFFVEAFVKFQDSVMGKENRKYLSITGTSFLFVFLGNLLGLVPGMPAITTTVWVTASMSLAVFLYFNYLGFKEHGFLGYLKHFFAGAPWFVGLFIFPLEIFSTCLRALTLNLRMYWNISADHMVLEALTNIFGIGAFPVYILGVFVSFMQAFVFTVLTMVYIQLATEHGDDHGDH